jgi:hypothetical protein
MSTEPQLDQAPAHAQGYDPGRANGHDHSGHTHSHHTHHAHHSGHASHAHTPAPSVPAEPIDLAAGTPSLLMRSAGTRVAGALLMISALWLAVGWALMERAP